jgi:hypothetical protein
MDRDGMRIDNPDGIKGLLIEKARGLKGGDLVRERGEEMGLRFYSCGFSAPFPILPLAGFSALDQTFA